MTAHDSPLGLGQGAAPEEFIEILRDWLVRLPADALTVANAAEGAAGMSDDQATLRTACDHLLRVTSLQSQIEDLVAVECAILLRLAVQSAPLDAQEGDPRLNVLGEECALLEQNIPEELPQVREHMMALLAKQTQSSSTESPSEPESQVNIASTEQAPDSAAAGDQVDERGSTLREQVAVWGETYSPPSFGAQAHALTRLRAFLRNRKAEIEA